MGSKRGGKKVAGGQHSSTPTGRRLTRNEYPGQQEPSPPETGHTSRLPVEEVVELEMGSHWLDNLVVMPAPDRPGDRILDMDPRLDPVLLWAGKRERKPVAILPLQRNEVVSESRLDQMIKRAQRTGSFRPGQVDFFADVERQERIISREQRMNFYTHTEDWHNKLIAGDSLAVMQSLIEYNKLAGKVQMIYIDPPYGIGYNSNFQQRITTTSNDEKDHPDDVLTIKAYRDTWQLGIHSYLSYLQERLYLCRQLLTESGSVFVQINEDNVHLVRGMMDEVFGRENYVTTITFSKTASFTSNLLSSVYDCLVWYARDKEQVKFNTIYQPKSIGTEGAGVYNKVELPDGTRRRLTTEELDKIDALPNRWRVYAVDNVTSQDESKELQPFEFEGKIYDPPKGRHWSVNVGNMSKLAEKGRIVVSGTSLRYVRYYDDFPVSPMSNIWLDTGTGSFTDQKVYVVQTNTKVVERCIQMTTDTGDLVLDPTCGSGTTAFCAEKWGRRWITCDTSRVALNVARRRLLSAIFPGYLLKGEIVADGFQYKTVQRVTLKSLANDLPPERVELVNEPLPDKDVLRVCGPFEVLTVGRYSIEDWRGQYRATKDGAAEDYIAVITRLYARYRLGSSAALEAASGMLHAIVSREAGAVALSVGPLTGRVTPQQIDTAAQDAAAQGIRELHVLGWSFDASVGEQVRAVADKHGALVVAVAIRPDTLVGGLAVAKGEGAGLFADLTLPEVSVSYSTNKSGEREATVTLHSVSVYNRTSGNVESYQLSSDAPNRIAAWYLDENYDGDCFVDCQMFFDFSKMPNLRGIDVPDEEFKLQFTSHAFTVETGQRIAVKVVDVYGNESTHVQTV